MTVQTQVFKVIASGNDVATVFSFSPMELPDDSSQISVLKTTSAGVETTLTEENTSTGYSVSVASFPGTGSVTYPATGGTPLATGETITMKRILVLEQQLDLENQGAWAPETQETQFDRLVMIDLQQQEILDRSFAFPVSYNGGASAEIPEPEALQVLRWNSAADALENASDVGDTLFTLPGSSTDNAVIRWDGTGAAAAQDSGVLVDDSDNVTGVVALTTTGAIAGGTTIAATTDVTAGADLIEPAYIDIASATTTNMGALAGRKVRITGTTTITAFDTVAAGIERKVRFAAALTLTHNGTSLILPTAANITTAANDFGVFVSLGSGNWICTEYMKASGVALSASVNTIVQVVHSQDAAVATGTTVLPKDDTIPQNTEGDEYMTLAITPTNTNNKLLIEAVVHASSTVATNEQITVALFQDSTAGALAASFQGESSGTTQVMQNIVLRHEMTAGTVSSTTFKIRIGDSGAGTTTFNGAGGARLFGGVLASSLRITEITV